MKRLLRALLPPALLLGLGLAALGFLLRGQLVLDLRLPFCLWLAALPLSGGCSLGVFYPGRYRRAALLNGGFWLLPAAFLLLFYGILLPWQVLLLLAVEALLLSCLGAWLGAGFALARAALAREAAETRGEEA